MLDARFYLLHVADAVVPLAHYDVEMTLASCLGVPNARLEYLLGFLDELPVEVNRIVGDPAGGVVFAENVLGRLLVIGVLLCLVALALVRERFGTGTFATSIRLMRLGRTSVNTVHFATVVCSTCGIDAYPVKARRFLAGLLPRKISQPVIFGLGIVVCFVVEG